MLGPLMIDIAGTALSPADRDLLRHPLLCGVILFSRNFVDPAQVSALISDIHALRDPRLLVAVDQEGGRVQRFRQGYTELPALARIGERYVENPDAGLALAADCAWLMASELRAVGIDFSFAPVLDLRSPASRVIGDRAFHADPHVVARLAQAYLAGQHRAGMAAVGKHFPGHGLVAADSHVELPEDERDFQDIEQCDLVPFRALVAAGIDGIMSAHVRYPRIDGEVAGYSRFWIHDILRQEMGFEGLVFSDDLSMAGAVGVGDYATRAVRSLAAGCDVLLVCNDRAGAIACIDALGDYHHPPTQVRLMRMHARGTAAALDDLRAQSGWQRIVAQLEALNQTPELALGDDNPRG